MEDLDISIYTTEAELLEVTVGEISELVDSQLTSTGKFHLALTGGTLGNLIAKELAAEFSQGDWRGLHIWWSDERFVEANSIERNAFPFHNTVLNKNIVIHEGLASDVAKNIDEAVADYALALENVDIDLNILGIGPDGHVASLFPGIADIDDTRTVFAITNSPKPPASRISFTMKEINSAAEVWIIAAGESKAEAVTKVIEGDLSIPASYVRGNSHTRLIVDTEAFFSE